MTDHRYQALDLAVKAGDASLFSEFLALLSNGAPTLYRAPLRHVSGKDYTRLPDDIGASIVAVVYRDGGQWVAVGYHDWSVASRDLPHVTLHNSAPGDVYGIFERAPT